MLQIEVAIWCCNLMLQVDVASWCCRLKLQIDVANWCCRLKLQIEVAIWSCRLMLQFDVAIWSWSCYIWSQSIFVRWVPPYTCIFFSGNNQHHRLGRRTSLPLAGSTTTTAATTTLGAPDAGFFSLSVFLKLFTNWLYIQNGNGSHNNTRYDKRPPPPQYQGWRAPPLAPPNGNTSHDDSNGLPLNRSVFFFLITNFYII